MAATTMAQADTPSDVADAISNEEQADEQTAEQADGSIERLTKDELFHVLQNERRRRVLRYILERGDGTYEMRDIAEHVAAWEHDTTVQALNSTQRQRVYIALYQSHLPKLDDVGLIEYNQKRGIVEETPLVNQTAAHIDVTEEDGEDEGSEPEEQTTRARLVVLGLSAITLGSIAAAALGFSGGTLSPVIALGATLTGLFSAVALGTVISGHVGGAE